MFWVKIVQIGALPLSAQIVRIYKMRFYWLGIEMCQTVKRGL
jgi:hypothetical protein